VSRYIFILIFLFASCLKEDKLKKPFITYAPREINDGWTISTPQAEQIDAAGLTTIYRDFHSDESLWQVRSLLVFRNGKLVAESYTKDDNDISTPRAIWSCTKQVVGLLTGIAIDQQLIGSVDDSLYSYLPATSNYPDKKNIRISDLLTMRSGIDYSNDGLSGQTDDILRQLPDNVTDFILGRSLDHTPGTYVQYKDGDPQLISAVIQSRCGTSMASWANDVLITRLGIKNFAWNNYKDGTTLGGFGILTTPREMARFGQCVLDSGQWNGATIVSKDWIKEMTTVRIPDLYDKQFGYQWWLDQNRGMASMDGHGGQYVCVIPAKNLIVVMTAEVNTQDDFQVSTDEAYPWVDRIAAISH